MKKKVKLTKKELEQALERKSNEYTALVEKVKSIVGLLREHKLISQEELEELSQILSKNYESSLAQDLRGPVWVHFSDRHYG